MKGTERIIFGAAAGLGIFWMFRSLGSGANGADPGSGLSSQERRVMSYWPQIQEAGLLFLIDPAVLSAMMEVESGGVLTAKGQAGKVGLMQIMPATGSFYCGVTAAQLLDAQTNITCAAKYLAGNINLFASLPAGIAAYNCGPGNVRTDLATQKLTIPASTLNHVRKVRLAAERYRMIWPDFMSEYLSYYTDYRWNMDWVWPFTER